MYRSGQTLGDKSLVTCIHGCYDGLNIVVVDTKQFRPDGMKQ